MIILVSIMAVTKLEPIDQCEFPRAPIIIKNQLLCELRECEHLFFGCVQLTKNLDVSLRKRVLARHALFSSGSSIRMYARVDSPICLLACLCLFSYI